MSMQRTAAASSRTSGRTVADGQVPELYGMTRTVDGSPPARHNAGV